MIWWLESPFSTNGFKVQSFFPSMNEMDGKKHLNNFFKLDSLRRIGLFLGRRPNGSPNHVPP
jgi:hypothetical protein